MKAKMKQDYIRPFATLWKGGEYNITDYSDGFYTMRDSYGDEFLIADYILKMIADIIDNSPSKSNPTVNIWHRDVSIAAEWIYNNNRFAPFTSIAHAEESIYRSIYNLIKMQNEVLKNNPDSEVSAYCGGAGYYVHWQWEDEEYANILVTVEPAVAVGTKGVHVVSETLDVMLEYYEEYGE